MSEVPKLKLFNKNDRSPDMIIFFLYCIKNMSFSSSPKGTPPRPVQKNYEKTILQWKPMELGGVPEKHDEYRCM